MRPLLVLTAALLLSGAGPTMEQDIARPGGVYSSMPTQDAGACARACAEDGLCMAWTFAAGACDLKAIAPNPQAYVGAISGLSARAPAFARLVAPPPSASPPSAPPLDAQLRGPTTPPDWRDTAAPAAPPEDYGLLGGPIAYAPLTSR